MDLNHLLANTQSKVKKVSTPRKPASIATDDRPYDLPSFINDEEKIIQKSATNRQQIGNKLETNRQLNRQQIGNIENGYSQIDNKPATNEQLNRQQFWQQIDNKPATITSFASLVGLQREIVIFIYETCKFNRSKETDSMTLECLSHQLHVKKGVIKTTIQRLEAKGCIFRVGFKKGRGGWSKYAIPETIVQEINQYEFIKKSATNWQQTGNKSETESTTQPATMVSSSSSDLFNKKNTTTRLQDHENIDINPLSSIGFSITHLTQILNRTELSQDVIQESINAFAFDLNFNGKGKELKKSPLDFFMGILNRGNPYNPPHNYETPSDKAWREYVERKEAIALKNKELEERAFNLTFDSWVSSPDNAAKVKEVLDSIVPAMRNVRAANDAALKQYFQESEWLQKKSEMLMECTKII